MNPEGAAFKDHREQKAFHFHLGERGAAINRKLTAFGVVRDKVTAAVSTFHCVSHWPITRPAALHLHTPAGRAPLRTYAGESFWRPVTSAEVRKVKLVDGGEGTRESKKKKKAQGFAFAARRAAWMRNGKVAV